MYGMRKKLKPNFQFFDLFDACQFDKDHSPARALLAAP
jgi:hypothetical protein